ncbi:MAG: hypothetical protein AAF731_06090 [Bacteroidota bacterium]
MKVEVKVSIRVESVGIIADLVYYPEKSEIYVTAFTVNEDYRKFDGDILDMTLVPRHACPLAIDEYDLTITKDKPANDVLKDVQAGGKINLMLWRAKDEKTGMAAFDIGEHDLHLIV